METKINKIIRLQAEIEILESERGAYNAQERKAIHAKIDELLSIIDCLQEACS